MCIFITAIVPAETALPQLNEVCEKHGFSVDQMDNASLRTMMPDGYQFLPVGGSCNCDTPLGYAHRTIYQPHDLSGDISKLKRKGWSAAKIERWSKDKERAPQQRQELKDRELQQWEDWINEILRSHSTKTIAVVLHFYNGGINTDPIKLKRIERVSIDELSVDKLANLDSDVLYRFSET